MKSWQRNSHLLFIKENSILVNRTIVQQIFTLPFLALCGVAPDLHVEALITNMMEFGNETLGDN